DVVSLAATAGAAQLTTQLGFFDHDRTSPQQLAAIRWHADVTILGGRDGAPLLVIDETGRIAAANAVWVDGAPAQVGQPIGETAVVRIVNDGGGNILLSSLGAITNATSVPAGTPLPLFVFEEALG